MIFVTIGEQLPFDRLIRTVDEWAGISDHEVFAQTGKTTLKPTNIKHKDFLNPEEFTLKFRQAHYIVAHAGMGTIISAIEMAKPILVMPRKAALSEHRNDHQFATAKRFLALNYISVAFDEVELSEKLNNIDDCQFVKGVEKLEPSPRLIKIIRDFIVG
ncbi:glucuronosyltransferase [Candidatus Pacearchaeota archaeon]|nr:glucuronosyltransferase [Candidatus Pacearchaeota archaeon]